MYGTYIHKDYTDAKLPFRVCNTWLEQTYSFSINIWTLGLLHGQTSCCFCSLL